MKALLMIAPLVSLVATACASAPQDASVAKDAAAPVMRDVATCSNVSYFGGYVVEVRESSQDATSELVIDIVGGPDGDGDDHEPAQTFTGTKTNADERDPYMYLYEAGGNALSITLERRDDYYPALLTLASGEVIALDCTFR